MFRKTLLAAGALAASAAAAQAQTEITWWHAMGGKLGEVVNEISTQFNASQSEYKITPVYKGGYEETLTNVIAAFRAGEQPNIVQVFDAGSATIIGAKGAVLPAEDLLNEAGAGFDVTDYIDGVRYMYADASGKMIGMPFNSSTPILYYNTEALEKAGVEAPKTWEEFEQIAPKLKAAGYVPLAQSHMPWIFVENFFSRHNLPFATQNNGYDSAQSVELLLSSTPEIQHHFEKLREWQQAGLFGYYGPGWNDNQQPFENGDVAMWIGSSGSFGGLQQSMKHPFSSTFLPYWGSVEGAGGSTFIGGAALFALAGHPAEENKATAAFFEFLTSPEVQYMWHRETGYVPITTAAYEMAKADGYYDEKPSAETGILQLMLPAGEWTKGYRLGFYPQVRDVINRETGKIFSGETSVEDALKTIDAEGDKILERFAKTSG
ncbi:extracellular solute-binding protein [Albimonas sp. CAU 1670]|uniref:extracellular solute-binding protein n=1 Tax=Albimonas sp. CAU 1670 TaxID=3032599 RepID=UPI0023DB44FC|nr:extracellular solute-binding protein [Albimonas sp. CAU 1670]MDF2233958.1 extracellular solute-binding protein [Albimonas sp. CAU 1670]